MRARDKKCGWTILVGAVLMATVACMLANSNTGVAVAAEETSGGLGGADVAGAANVTELKVSADVSHLEAAAPTELHLYVDDSGEAVGASADVFSVKNNSHFAVHVASVNVEGTAGSASGASGLSGIVADRPVALCRAGGSDGGLSDSASVGLNTSSVKFGDAAAKTVVSSGVSWCFAAGVE